MSLSDEEIDEKIRDKRLFEAEEYLYHTQAVERMIKLVTEASFEIIDKNERERFIMSLLPSRKRMPSFDSKNQFNFS